MGRPSRKLRTKRTVALVGDGHTERIYFADVRETDRPANLAIFPDFPRKIGSYKGVLDRAIAIVKEYETVFALIDIDAVIHQNQLVAYKKAKQIAIAKGVVVLENNPCFEIWLLLHFVQTSKLFNTCEEVTDQLKSKDKIPGYDKGEKFLANARLYKRLKDLIKEKAIPNARLLEKDRNDIDSRFPRAETFRFFEWYFEMENLK